MTIGRRAFIARIGAAQVALLSVARSQNQSIPVIGILGAIVYRGYRADFDKGLSETGFVEGRNVIIEERNAEGQYDRLPALAAELVRRQVTVIAAITPVAALAAKAATSTIPVVFELGSDPIKDGLVTNLARPDGNVTGISFFANLLTAKQFELLHDALPEVVVVGYLLNPDNANAELELGQAQLAAKELGLQLVVARARSESEIDIAFTDFVQKKATAAVISGDAYLNYFRYQQIAALALRHAIATCFTGRMAVANGGLFSYGADRKEADRQFGIYVGRILKGEKPSNLPVVQSTKFEMIINLTTAKVLGLTISRELLLRADEVIE
jgi:putative tryptophan/tyrosine transport system substrate-binding protein